MSKDQKGFIVYGDNEIIFDRLTDEEAGQLLKGMTKYFNSGTEPEFDSPLTDVVWLQIKLQMDRNADKYEKKCQKNRESIQKYWDKVKADTNEYERIRTNTNATNRDRDKDTKTDTDRDTESVPDVFSLSRDLIQYLNEKAGTSYKSDGAVTAHIQFWLNNGYTPLQLRTVIDKKCGDWLNDDKMRGYLRPSTLFGDKFPEYLAAPISLVAERQKKAADDRASLERQLDEKKSALSVLKESLAGADKSERKLLRENIAILEDSIGVIERRLS